MSRRTSSSSAPSSAAAAVAEPTIDVGIGPNSAFSKLAVAAGLIVAGQTFNPYADDISFLLGASIFEDVGVTAYAGAARYIGTPDYLEAAAGILAVEAYHSGAVRTLLANIGAGTAFGLISDSAQVRLSGKDDDQGILIPGNNYNFIPTTSTRSPSAGRRPRCSTSSTATRPPQPACSSRTV